MKQTLYRNRTGIIIFFILTLLIVSFPGENFGDPYEFPSSGDHIITLSEHLTLPYLPEGAEIEKLASIIHIQSLPARKTFKLNTLLLFEIITLSLLSFSAYLIISRFRFYRHADQMRQSVIEYIHNQEDNK